MPFLPYYPGLQNYLTDKATPPGFAPPQAMEPPPLDFVPENVEVNAPWPYVSPLPEPPPLPNPAQVALREAQAQDARSGAVGTLANSLADVGNAFSGAPKDHSFTAPLFSGQAVKDLQTRRSGELSDLALAKEQMAAQKASERAAALKDPNSTANQWLRQQGFAQGSDLETLGLDPNKLVEERGKQTEGAANRENALTLERERGGTAKDIEKMKMAGDAAKAAAAAKGVILPPGYVPPKDLTPEAAKDFENKHTETANLVRMAKNYKKAIEDASRSEQLWGEKAGELESMRAQLQLGAQHLHNVNRLNEVDVNQFLEKLVPSAAGYKNALKSRAAIGGALDNLVKGAQEDFLQKQRDMRIGSEPGAANEFAPQVSKPLEDTQLTPQQKSLAQKVRDYAQLHNVSEEDAIAELSNPGGRVGHGRQ